MNKRRAYILAVGLCLVFFGLSFLSVYNDTLTSDEVSHIPDGYYYLNTGRYFINPEHPPIIKDLSALPLLFFQPELPDFEIEQEYYNPQWEYGRDFLFYANNDPDRIVFWARLAMSLGNTLLLFLLFVFLEKAWSARAGVLATFFIAISPTFLAHGSLATTDTIFSLFLMLSLASFALWLKNFREKRIEWLYFGLTILLTAGALLTKFSAFLILPVLLFGGLIYLLFKHKLSKTWWQFLLLFIVLGIAVVLLIGLFYAPHVKNMDPGGLQYQIDSNYPHNWPEFGRNYMEWSTDKSAFFKGLTEYGIGVLMVRGRLSSAWQTIYFLGEVYGSEGAGLAYFPVLYLTKITLGFLLALIISIIFGIQGFVKHFKNKFKGLEIRPLIILLWGFILLYTITSLTSKLQIGLRHILPVMTAIYLLVGYVFDKKWEQRLGKNRKLKYNFLFLLIMLICFMGSLLAFPHYLSYYNVLAGGSQNGYKIATDSNYDWMNQDIKRLANYLAENNIEYYYGDLDVNFPAEYYLGNAQINFDIRNDQLPRSGEYLIVSAENMQRNDYQDSPSESQKYSSLMPYLKDRVGMTLFVFQMP